MALARVREGAAGCSRARSSRFQARQHSRSLPSGSDGAAGRSSAAARERGVHPGYALGRDYEGLDDALLVAVTEKRTPADIDRLAGVIAEVVA